MISSSIGLIVWMLMSSASIPSAASISTAFTASDTQSPVAMIDMSLPSLSLTPLPISNLYVLSSLSTWNCQLLPNLRYTGPTYSYAAFDCCSGLYIVTWVNDNHARGDLSSVRYPHSTDVLLHPHLLRFLRGLHRSSHSDVDIR